MTENNDKDVNSFVKATGQVHNEEKYQELITELTGKTKEERQKEFDEMYAKTCPPIKNRYIL